MCFPGPRPLAPGPNQNFMQLWLIPIFPLAGFLVNGLFGRRFSKALVNTFAIGSVLLSFAWVLKTLVAVRS